MEAWKKELVDEIIAKSAQEDIICLKDVAAAHGIDHAAKQDVQEMRNYLKRALPDFRPEQKQDDPAATLFQTLYFVRNGVNL